MIDFSSELVFITSRSEGKGGQNVNKLETKVTAKWPFKTTTYFTSQQILIIEKALHHHINKQNELVMYAQQYRTQRQNKELVISKMLQLVHQCLIPKKIRIATTTTNKAIENRLQNKQKRKLVKELRGKVKHNTFD